MHTYKHSYSNIICMYMGVLCVPKMHTYVHRMCAYCWTSLYACMYVCVHVCMYVHDLNTLRNAVVCTYVCMHVCMYACMYVHDLHILLNAVVCMYLCVHACTYVFVCMYVDDVHVLLNARCATNVLVHLITLIFIMVVFFLASKKTILIPNAENKDRTGAFWLRNLNLSFFYREKKRQSLWKWEYQVNRPTGDLCFFIEVRSTITSRSQSQNLNSKLLLILNFVSCVRKPDAWNTTISRGPKPLPWKKIVTVTVIVRPVFSCQMCIFAFKTAAVQGTFGHGMCWICDSRKKWPAQKMSCGPWKESLPFPAARSKNSRVEGNLSSKCSPLA